MRKTIEIERGKKALFLLLRNLTGYFISYISNS